MLALLRAALPTGSCTFEKNGCGWAEGGKKNGWKRGTRTPSSSTGAAKGQGGKGSFYFLETSSGKKGDTSYLTHTITEGSDLYKSVSFYYHMHGATMGALSLQAQVGGSWRTVWKKEKQQQKRQTDKFIMAKVRHMKQTRLSSQGPWRALHHVLASCGSTVVPRGQEGGRSVSGARASSGRECVDT